MTPQQIELIKSSFAVLSRDVEATSNIFYTCLFELNPKLRLLFNVSSRVQGYKLIVMFGSVVANLENLAAITPVLEELGARHVQYGVTEEDYDTVSEALLWTLEQILGETYRPEVREAWLLAYGFLAKMMKAGARSI